MTYVKTYARNEIFFKMLTMNILLFIDVIYFVHFKKIILILRKRWTRNQVILVPVISCLLRLANVRLYNWFFCPARTGPTGSCSFIYFWMRRNNKGGNWSIDSLEAPHFKRELDLSINTLWKHSFSPPQNKAQIEK